MNDWHPMLATREGPTGTWHMLDPDGREYGRIEIRRVMNGTDVMHKATRPDGAVLWCRTLRAACERLHEAYLHAAPKPVHQDLIGRPALR